MESKGGRKREYELGCCSSGANHLVSDKESLKRLTVGQARRLIGEPQGPLESVSPDLGL